LAAIKNFSIVNILAGERIIPELIQRDFTPQNILEETKKISDSEDIRSEMIAGFRKIKNLLGDKTAPQNAAQELEKLIKQKQDTAKRQLESK
jgi:lipid-A-disaccharide synthase